MDYDIIAGIAIMFMVAVALTVLAFAAGGIYFIVMAIAHCELINVLYAFMCFLMAAVFATVVMCLTE